MSRGDGRVGREGAVHRRFGSPPLIALVSCLVVFIYGCSGTSQPATPLPSEAPAQALECEAGAFPCAFADVPEEVRTDTERLAAEAIRRVNDGASNDELVVWLDSEESVAEVEGDADAVRFRPIGGRGVWITRRIQAVAAPATLTSDAVAMAGTWENGISGPMTNEAVTGEGLPVRQAVVLSPYKWDFGASDDGQAVADRLREMPDYATGVTYAENAKVDSTDVSVDDFRGWRGFQVVHVVSHGFRLCKDAKCRAVVAANALPGATANVWGRAVRGLELEVVAGDESSPRPTYHMLLGADFFRDEYRGGLNETLVFLNGCATFGPGATDLADAIRGTKSVVLGWSRTVDSDAAESAATAMYAELAGGGRTVGDALVLIGDLTTSESQSSATETLVSTLTSTGRAAGGDLRIRDVVVFQDAALDGPLAEAAAVPLIGEPGDGVPDSVGWSLLVDGIEAQAASAIVHVTIDGRAASPMTVSTGAAVGTSTWRLQGTVDLGVDVSAPHPAQFEATLDLPEGGVSVDRVAATLVGESEPTPGPALGTVWRGRATERHEQPFDGVWTVAEADLTFTLRPRTDGLPIFAYELTSGVMTFSVSGMRSDGCTYDLPPAEITITPEMAASAGEFVIDARNSPPTFYGVLHISGPEVDVMQTCPDPYAYLTGPYSTRAQGIFIDVSVDEKRTVLGDRISGTSTDGSRTFDIARAE